MNVFSLQVTDSEHDQADKQIQDLSSTVHCSKQLLRSQLTHCMHIPEWREMTEQID